MIKQDLLESLPKSLRLLPWVMDRFVPWTPLTLSEVQQITKAYHVSVPKDCYEVNLGKLISQELFLNGRTLWLTNQVGDLSWHIGKQPFGSSQFVLRII